MSKEIYTQTCAYILVDFDKTKKGRNNYRLTLMTQGDNIPLHRLPQIHAIRKVYAKCDYNLISYSHDGEVLTGPFVVTYTLDAKDRAVLTEFHKIDTEGKGKRE